MEIEYQYNINKIIFSREKIYSDIMQLKGHKYETTLKSHYAYADYNADRLLEELSRIMEFSQGYVCAQRLYNNSIILRVISNIIDTVVV